MTKLNEFTQDDKSQDKKQNLVRNAIASLFILQALFIGVNGNHDILSGKSPLDVIPWMLTQSVELLTKAKKLEDETKK